MSEQPSYVLRILTSSHADAESQLAATRNLLSVPDRQALVYADLAAENLARTVARHCTLTGRACDVLETAA